MIQKFIRRLVLAIVVSLVRIFLGALAIHNRPISQFPEISPPLVSVTLAYQGASASVLIDAALIPIERAINGVPGMRYIVPDATSAGEATVQVVFEPGTDADLAVVNVKNRIDQVASLLPELVRLEGIVVSRVQPSMLMYVNLYSTDPSASETFLYNCASVNLIPELQRIPGIGRASILGLLQEGDPLTVVADNSQMWVYFNVSEREYLAYRRAHAPNDPVAVRLRMANEEVFPHPGTTQTIEADFNSETGTIAFRAGFPNPEGLLRHGETGEILMSSTLSGAVLVPQKATYTVLDRTFVFVVGPDDVVHARATTVGESLPHQTVVTSGLREGERVLIDGLRRVRDGDPVTPTVRDAEEVFAEMSRLPAE